MVRKTTKIGLIIVILLAIVGVALIFQIKKPMSVSRSTLPKENAIEMAKKYVEDQWWLMDNRTYERLKVRKVLSAELLPIEEGPFPESVQKVLDKVWKIELMLENSMPWYNVAFDEGAVKSWITQVEVWMDAYSGDKLAFLVS
ncbi:MAG: hypothetical protein ACE5OT_05850 [Candidatus Hadarchaeaceae archaeon]